MSSAELEPTNRRTLWILSVCG